VTTNNTVYMLIDFVLQRYSLELYLIIHARCYFCFCLCVCYLVK